MMHKAMYFCTSIVVILAALGFASNANATVALCVGCTTPSQFEGAAWQAFGTGYTQGVEILVVNPDTGLSMWVDLVHLPPGVGRNAVRANEGVKVQHLIEPGVATPLDSNPFSAIYIAKDHVQRPEATGTGTQSASAYGVSSSEQIAINTAIELTKKTYFIELNPSEFPSYEGSLQVEIAEQNFTSLSQVPGLNWPESAFSDSFFKSLLQVLGVYTGHSFLVCDVFGNGDSACFVPDPQTNNVLVQSGPAKNANGQQLPLITNQVSGGGGGGMGVTQNPPNILYSYPSSGGGGSITCAYVNGRIQYCIEQE